MAEWWTVFISVSCAAQAIALLCLFSRLEEVLERLRNCRLSFEVGVLSAPPGSTVVLTPPAPLSKAQLEMLKEQLAQTSGAEKFVLLESGWAAALINQSTE